MKSVAASAASAVLLSPTGMVWYGFAEEKCSFFHLDKYDNAPLEINRLSCRVNYYALNFLPEIEEMDDLLAAGMRNWTGSPNPYMALHMRLQKGMVGLSFCDFVGTRKEKVMMGSIQAERMSKGDTRNCGNSFNEVEALYWLVARNVFGITAQYLEWIFIFHSVATLLRLKARE